MSWSRRVLFAVPVLLVLSASMGFAAVSQIVVDENDINFGTVAQGEKVERVFRFSNAGDDLLKIERVKSSCGCTAALLADRDLEPGTTGEVRATFDSTRFQGLVVKTIYLYTNDPMHKVVQLHLRGEVRRELSVSPKRLVLESVIPGQQTLASVEIANVGDKEFVVERAEVTVKEARVDFTRRVLQPGEQAEITLQVTVPEGNGGFNGYLLINLSGTVITEQRIPLAVKVAQ